MIKANESMMLDQMDVNDRDGATVVCLRMTLNRGAQLYRRASSVHEFSSLLLTSRAS